MWDQYFRDLAIFGTNAIELISPRSDDADDSPHFPLPKMQMNAAGGLGREERTEHTHGEDNEDKQHKNFGNFQGEEADRRAQPRLRAKADNMHQVQGWIRQPAIENCPGREGGNEQRKILAIGLGGRSGLSLQRLICLLSRIGVGIGRLRNILCIRRNELVGTADFAWLELGTTNEVGLSCPGVRHELYNPFRGQMACCSLEENFGISRVWNWQLIDK
jgi:hypothetical protein